MESSHSNMEESGDRNICESGSGSWLVHSQYEYEPFSQSIFSHKEETGNTAFHGTDDGQVRENLTNNSPS